MKRAKHIILAAVGVMAMIGVLLGVFVYQARYRTTPLDASVSPGGSYELTLFSVGEPDWPFGSAHGRVTLKKDGKVLSKTEFDLAQDGCRISTENWSVAWRSDRAEVTLHASEQADERWNLYFNGQVERFADSTVEENRGPSAQKQNTTALSMKASALESGESIFKVSAADFIESFNDIYEERNAYTYLKSLDEWMLLEEKTPFYAYHAACYCFSADAKRWSMPLLSIYAPENGEGIYEFKLTFDHHGYQEAMYQEFQEMCFCALSAVLPDLSADEITALYSKLYAQTEKNPWGSYDPDPDKERPGIEIMYCREGVGLYGYYGAGTANICIVPLVENAAELLIGQGIDFQSIK